MHRRISWARAITVVALIAFALAGCGGETGEDATPPPEGAGAAQAEGGHAETLAEGGAGRDVGGVRAENPGSLPRLVDLGRDTCIPCKMMAPILEELKREYEGRAVVEVIDLREDSQAASKYGLRVIPTQIFFDSEGKEVWRHEGFLSKEDIVARFAEMGVTPLDD